METEVLESEEHDYHMREREREREHIHDISKSRNHLSKT
jgi:hypothetical protein